MSFKYFLNKAKEETLKLSTEDVNGNELPVEDLIYNQFADRVDIDKSSDDVNIARAAKDADENIDVISTTYEEGIRIKADVENTLEYTKEVINEADDTLADISNADVKDVEETLSKYKQDLDIVDTSLDLATESIDTSTGNKYKFERMSNNLELIDKEIFVNLEGVLGSLISGFGSSVMSIKKLLVSKKSYIDSMLSNLKSLPETDLDDDKVTELFENKFKDKGEPYYALYIGGDNAIVKYLESSLEELKQGNKISFSSLHEFDLPDRLKFVKKLVDTQAENDISTDANTLVYDADDEIKYEMHKLTSCTVIGKVLEVRYAVKYNVGTAFHTLNVEVPAIDMPIDLSTVKEILTEASENTGIVSNLLEKIKSRSEEISRNFKEDTEEGNMFKKLFNSYVKKYEKAIDGYYDYIEAVSKFYIREYEHADNNDTADKIVDTVVDGVSAVGRGIKNVGSSIADSVTGNLNNGYY